MTCLGGAEFLVEACLESRRVFWGERRRVLGYFRGLVSFMGVGSEG